MKKRAISALTAVILSLSLISAALPQSALGAGAGNLKYRNTRELAPNLKYVNSVYWNDDYGREEDYALRLKPGTGDAYAVVVKDETVYGSVDIDGSIAYAQSQGLNVLGGINADFFASGGYPLGLFIENGEYKSSPGSEAAVGFLADGTIVFSQTPGIKLSLVNFGNGGDSPNAGKSVEVPHLNKVRYDHGGNYLFTSDFSAVSTRTSGAGWFVRFKILEGELTVSGEMLLSVIETFEYDGAIPIEEGTIVLSAGGAANDDYAKFAPGDYVRLYTECADESLASAVWASGCGDTLVQNGEVTDAERWDKDLLVRSPKTAIGVTAEGEIVAYVVDGRNTTYGNGITLYELAEQMKELGCVTAVNLDGGGSSVMSVRIPGQEGAQSQNRPSDGKPRKCATYILFVTQNASDGAVRSLALSNEGTIVLAGSSFELEFTATDGGYRPITAPGDITAASYGLGSVNGKVYTAGETQGMDKVELYSWNTGGNGTGEVFVLTNPTSVTAYTKAGTAITDVNITPGGTLELAPVATYYRKSVIAQPHSFEYEVTGDIGTVSENGVFTAAEIGNRTGEIIIKAGAQSTKINVTLQGFEDTVNHWAREYINELYASGIIAGVTATKFEPESNIRRCDFVLMLHRAVGSPEPEGEVAGAFDDVPTDAYYAKAVAWAKEQGIATGVGDGLFDPSSPLTREQAFTLVYRALGLLKIEAPEEYEAILGSFTDGGEVAGYAISASETLIALGVVGGSDGKILPKEALTRAQMAKILCVTLRLRDNTVEAEPIEEIVEDAPEDTPEEITEDTEEVPETENEEPPEEPEAEEDEPVAVG